MYNDTSSSSCSASFICSGTNIFSFFASTYIDESVKVYNELGNSGNKVVVLGTKIKNSLNCFIPYLRVPPDISSIFGPIGKPFSLLQTIVGVGIPATALHCTTALWPVTTV